MSVALPIAANRRGACPSLDVPMQTGDGLLARLRVAGGRLTPEQLSTIAALAHRHGNGLIEITARGNLQVRGLTPASAAPFAHAVVATVPIETGLVVETPPLAGDDPTEVSDPRPLAAEIRAVAEPLHDRLGPKVTVIVDGGGQISLTALKADIRLVALSPDRWMVTIGNFTCGPLDSDTALQIARVTLQALAELGPTARASDLSDGRASQSAPSPLRGGVKGGGGLDPVLFPVVDTSTSVDTVHVDGLRTVHRQNRSAGAIQGEKAIRAMPEWLVQGRGSAGGSLHHPPPQPSPARGEGGRLRVSIIALPFGSSDHAALATLAHAAARHGITELRLAPHHALLAIGAPTAFIAEAAALGFITTAADPRTRISACIGSDGCASGHIPARATAGQLAAHLPAGATLHVSGCAKGCAHPRRAALTLVGRPDGYGLVIEGTAGDTPATLLRADQLESALAASQG